MAPSPRRASFGRRRLAAALVAASAAVALVLGGSAAGAMAAERGTRAAERGTSVPAAAATTGWVRLAHLSPDTKAVDIRLSALSGGSIVQSLSDIGYGAVSDYMALKPGTYVVAMAPTGSDFSVPVIQASVTVVAGQPLTVAAYGKNADLQAAIFQDDLSSPAAGQARVRVVQASTIVPTVNVATSTGMSIASGVAEGKATDYATVPSGPWTLDLTSGSVASKADVQLAAGSVSTLFVLDNATGGLALKAVLDSANAGALPAGGIQTGGGGTAAERTGDSVPPSRLIVDIVTGAMFLVVAGIGAFLYHRRTHRSPGAVDHGWRARETAAAHAEPLAGDPGARGAAAVSTPEWR